MSDTLRTDEREALSEGLHEGWGLTLARQLERELNEAKTELARRDEWDAKCLQSDSAIGSCRCMTKTPEVKYHAPGCKYRLICERDDAQDQLARVTKRFGILREALTQIDYECMKTEPQLSFINAAASVALLRVKEEPEA